jgi:hypothetical protein
LNKGIIAIIVSMLLFVTVPAVTATGTFNVYTPTQATTGILWSDNFDSYALGSSMHGQGGWKGWDNDPTWTAYVSDTQALSAPHSVEIATDADLVHEYGYTSGNYTFKTYVYIPGDFVGQSYFIMLSDYVDGAGAGNQWAVQFRMDSDLGVVEYEFDGVQDVLITDQWIELRVEIDLDNDWHQFYYDGLLLHEKAWTAGPNNQGTGFLKIAAVDLFANGASPVYYDDFTLYGPDLNIPDLDVTGELAWAQVPAGSTQTATLEVANVGTAGSELDWEVDSYPSWGTWTFTPSSGTDLTPAGSPISVDVEVVAPDETEKEFDGVVKFINTEDPSDFVEIAVTLSTPKPYNTPFLNFFERLVNRFPLLQRIF